VADTSTGLLVRDATSSGAAIRVRPLPSADVVPAAHSFANRQPSRSAASGLAACAAVAGLRPDYQYCVVAPEVLTTAPTISGRSNTDWMATRPGPCSVSHTDLACHRAELNQ